MNISVITTGAFQENCWLVWDAATREGFVLDPGEGVDEICQEIERVGMKPKAVLNTHAHIDHIQGVAGVRRRFRVPFHLHPEDRYWIDAARDSAAMYGIRLDETPIPDRDIADGDRFEAGAFRLTAIHTPGHTPGGVCFLGDGEVFVGDVLFAGSIGRTDFPGGSSPALMRSIRTRLLPLPDDTVVHSGHGPDTTIGRERRTNPFLTGVARL
ncbi:MAG: MBL fold metallo-hydrolase [Planctomycetes bacterium]|nr:MBL fold metallo-hydrolase [Planctomycetota bacterium]